jgi:hypothetical protein
MFLRFFGRLVKETAIVIPATFVFWLALRALPNHASFLKISFLLFLTWRAVQSETDWMEIQFSNPKYFREYVTIRLSSSSYWRRRWALRCLCMFVGNRFGVPLFPPYKVHRSMELWRSWWEANACRLIWEPTIHKYVEADSGL